MSYDKKPQNVVFVRGWVKVTSKAGSNPVGEGVLLKICTCTQMLKMKAWRHNLTLSKFKKFELHGSIYAIRISNGVSKYYASRLSFSASKSENLKYHPIDYCAKNVMVYHHLRKFIDILIMNAWFSLFLHSWLFFHPLEHNYTGQIAQF